MRWFMAAPASALVAALRNAGQIVIDEASLQIGAFLGDWKEPGNYPMARFGREAEADVVVLVDPLKDVYLPALGGLAQLCYYRKDIKKLRETRLRTLSVMWAPNDPATWNYFQSPLVPSCGARPSQMAVYVSSDAEVAEKASRTMRATFFDGIDAAPILALVEHARSGEIYRPARRR